MLYNGDYFLFSKCVNSYLFLHLCFSLQTFLQFAFIQQNEYNRWRCLFLPDKGAFFVNYVITSSLIGTGLELIRFPELFLYAIRVALSR